MYYKTKYVFHIYAFHLVTFWIYLGFMFLNGVINADSLQRKRLILAKCFTTEFYLARKMDPLNFCVDVNRVLNYFQIQYFVKYL